MDQLNLESIQDISQTVAGMMGVDTNLVADSLAAAAESGMMAKMIQLQKSLFRLQPTTYDGIILMNSFQTLLMSLGMQRHNEMPENEGDLDAWVEALIGEVRPAWETFIGGFLPNGEIDFDE